MINIVRAMIMLCMLGGVTGCFKGMALNEDREKLLKVIAQDGPQVEGVEATLLNNALEATSRGEHQKAAQLYRQLLATNNESTPYALGLADSLRRNGDTDAAEIVYQEIVEKEPKSVEAKEGYGLLRLSKGEFEKAGILLSEAHKKAPKRWQTLNGLGILLVERGTIPDAIAYFKEALKHSKNNPAVLNNIGLTYAIDDQPENALSALGEAIETSPVKSSQRKNIELNLALVMGIYGDMNAAEKILKSHLSEAAVANNLGLYAYLANNEVLAKSYLNTALSRSPYHYKRAWENLDTITKGKGNKRTSTTKPKSIKAP
jgi:Flp pilus assembly protein TadD